MPTPRRCSPAPSDRTARDAARRRVPPGSPAAGVGSPRVDAELLLAHVPAACRGQPAGPRRSGADDAAASRSPRWSRAEPSASRCSTSSATRAVPPHRAGGRARASSSRGPRPNCSSTPCCRARSTGARPCRRPLRGLRRPRRWPSRTSCPGARRAIAVEADPGRAAVAAPQRAGTRRRGRRRRRHATRRLLAASSRGTVDAVVSNPPYVPGARAVAPEVRADPREAVFAGPDGLALIPAVIDRAADAAARPAACSPSSTTRRHGEAVPALLRADDRGGRTSARTATSTGRPRYAPPSAADLPARAGWRRGPLLRLRRCRRPGHGDRRRGALRRVRSAGRAAHRHRLRHRRRRLRRRPRSPTCSPPRAAAGTCRCPCWSGPGTPSRGWPRSVTAAHLGPDRGLLAGRAHPRRRARAVAELGSRRRARHRRDPDAAASGRDRAARGHRADGACPARTSPASPPRSPPSRRATQLGDSVAVYLDGGPGRRPGRLDDRRRHRAEVPRILRAGAVSAEPSCARRARTIRGP